MVGALCTDHLILISLAIFLVRCDGRRRMGLRFARGNAIRRSGLHALLVSRIA